MQCAFPHVCLYVTVQVEKSSHLNILCAASGSYMATFMLMLPFYINSDYNVWRFCTAPFESTLKAGLPKGTRISARVNVCLHTVVFVYVCVCVLCLQRTEPRDISDATTVPVSCIPLKKHVDSDKPPLPPLFLLSLLSSWVWTGGDAQPQQTFITHSRGV